MFFNCSSLEEIDLSHFNTGNVKFMDDMFENCSSLQSVDLSNFVTSKVTDMRGMFSGCSSLTSLDLSNFDTGSVTSMGNMFSGCSNLTSLNLGSFNTGKVTNMKELFSGCSNLATLDISNFDISKIGQNYLSNMCTDVASAEHPCLLKVPEDFDFREDIDFSGDYFEWLGGYFRLPETDRLCVKPVSVLKGSPSTMAIELKNPSSKKYMGYQFNIVLPEGVSICKKDNGQYSYTQGNRYGNTQMMMNIREQNDGSYMVLCFSLSNTPISGHEGALLSLDITSDGTLDDGSYEGAIRGIKFSTTEDADALLPDATFKVNVSKYELGDVNNDGSVSITDITMAVNYILGKASDKFHASHGDMNHDGEINIADLSEMVEIILNSYNNAPVNIGVTGGLRMESAGSECSLYLPDAGLYKGCQFLVRVPSGCRLSDVSVGAGRESGHRVMYRQTGTGLYKVLVFSADGNEFEDVPSALLRLTVDGQNGGAVELSDIRFTDTDFTEHSFAAVSSEVTGIGAVTGGASESTWYSLDGQKTAQPLKGVFVRDGRKIVVK
jgi:surface protein